MLGYEPSPEQWKYHLGTVRIRQLVGGERAGKSYAMSMDAAARIIWMHKVVGITDGIYWIVGPDYGQPRAEFTYILEAMMAVGYKITDQMLSMPTGESSAWILTVPHAFQVQTKSGGDVRKIASKPLRGGLYAEAAQGTYDIVLKMLGRVSQYSGWLSIGGTLEQGLPWYGELYRQWQADNSHKAKSYSMPTWANRAEYPGGRDDPKIKDLEAIFEPELFDERFAAIPMRPRHIVFDTFDRERHISDKVKYNEKLPVSLAIDPGYYPGAYAVAVIQLHRYDDRPEELWMIDEVYVHRTVGADVIKLCKEKVWWSNTRLTSDHVIDIAGTQHHAETSQVERWMSDAGLWLQHQQVGIKDGIDRHRTLLIDPGTRQPRILHAPHCLNCFAEYDRYRYPDQGELMADRSIPIDKNNHLMKAIAYFGFHLYGAVDYEYREPEPMRARVKVT